MARIGSDGTLHDDFCVIPPVQPKPALGRRGTEPRAATTAREDSMTRKEIVEELDGIDDAVINAILKATARFRHQKRVQEAYEAANKVTARVYPYNRALLWLEAAIATEAAPGHRPTSQRLSPFIGLGSGRRDAIDGPAWTAAIADAARSGAGERTPPPSFELDAIERYNFPEVVVIVRDNDDAKQEHVALIGWLKLCNEDLLEIACFAAREAVRRGNRKLLRAAGILYQSTMRRMRVAVEAAGAKHAEQQEGSPTT